jgi:NADPH-dependent 2,4-dienoyl-CoA reductase/sulfur reductase-like enzyme
VTGSPPQAILVLGGGPAGTFAAIASKQKNPAATVTLLSDETCEPYEKPPLSKAVLVGKATPTDAPIAGPGGVAARGIALEPGARVSSIDRRARTVALEDGRTLTYDALVIATGSCVRELPGLPAAMARVHYLRSERDARQLTARLRESRRLLVVGAGLIGLEVAASAADMGVTTTVLELAPRILSRVCVDEISTLVEQAHRRHGIDLRLGCAVACAKAADDGIEVMTTAQDHITADVIVVGTGAKPNDALAAAAGLAVDDGVIVDEYCRTSDPAIFAAGDVVRFPGPHGPIRLENWRHALEQGAVAGRNAAGGADAYCTVPSFWSEQYDLYIQGVGWPAAETSRVTRPMPGNAALTFELKNDRLVAAMGINAQRDLAAARRLIERAIPIDPAALADPTQALAALLKR